MYEYILMSQRRCELRILSDEECFLISFNHFITSYLPFSYIYPSSKKKKKKSHAVSGDIGKKSCELWFLKVQSAITLLRNDVKSISILSSLILPVWRILYEYFWRIKNHWLRQQNV